MHLGLVSLAPSQSRLCPCPGCPNSPPRVTNEHPKNAAGFHRTCCCHSDIWGGVGHWKGKIDSLHTCVPALLSPHSPRSSLQDRNVSKVLGKLSCSLSCLQFSYLTFPRWFCTSAPSLPRKDHRTTLLQDSIARINALTVVLGTKAMRGWMNIKIIAHSISNVTSLIRPSNLTLPKCHSCWHPLESRQGSLLWIISKPERKDQPWPLFGSAVTSLTVFPHISRGAHTQRAGDLSRMKYQRKQSPRAHIYMQP